MAELDFVFKVKPAPELSDCITCGVGIHVGNTVGEADGVPA